MGSQRIRHNLVTKQQQKNTIVNAIIVLIFRFLIASVYKYKWFLYTELVSFNLA